MDDPIEEHPIERKIAAERQEWERQQAACTAASKKVRAKKPTMNLGMEDDWNRRTHGRVWIKAHAPIPKYSVNNNFIGWYRPYQKRGMPSPCLPIEREIEEACRDREIWLRRFINPADRAAMLGRKSGRARSIDTKASEILTLFYEMAKGGIQKCQRAHKIQLKLGGSVAYIRRVIREHLKE